MKTDARQKRNEKKYQTSPDDMKKMMGYVEMRGGTPAWRTAHLSLIENTVGMIGKPLPDITAADVYKVRNLIVDGGYAQNYKRRLVYALREFMIHAGVLTDADKKTMRLPARVLKTKSKKDMLTVEEVQRAIDAGTNPRDKFLISMLWDTNCRPSELLKLDWDDLKADEYGYSFETEGQYRKSKTMINRHIRLTTSLPYLEAWRLSYPGDASGKNPVFVTLRKIGGIHKRFDIDAAQAMITALKVTTGIKNLKPYQFRPSRITHDLRNHCDMAYVNLKAWGRLDSEMAEVYSHLDEDEQYLDQQALRAAGMKTREQQKQEKKEITVPTCPRCQMLNVSGARFCSHCQAPLTSEAIEQVQTAEEKLADEFKAFQRWKASQKV